MLYGYLSQNSDERKVVELITRFIPKNDHYPDLTFFYNLLFDPVKQEGIEDYQGFYVATDVKREEIGVERVGKPGDYDIVFIPYNNKDKLYYDRTAVYEVKIARPTFEKPNKDTNSVGQKQLYGLIEDGFPLVGLLHIVIAKPLLLEQTSVIKMGKKPINIDWQPGDPPQSNLDDLIEDQSLDWLPWYSMDRQMERLISAGFPKYVGINAFAITKNADGKLSISSSREYDGYTSGYFNPKMKQETIEKMEFHFLKYKDRRYRKISIWNHES